jgi:hypothetical protein
MSFSLAVSFLSSRIGLKSSMDVPRH